MRVESFSNRRTLTVDDGLKVEADPRAKRAIFGPVRPVARSVATRAPKRARPPAGMRAAGLPAGLPGAKGGGANREGRRVGAPGG